jgi:hypothetical protein
MLSRAAQNLPAVGFALAQDLRDLLVRIIEDFTQDENGALDRVEPLQQNEKGHRQGFVGLNHVHRFGGRLGDPWLG